jgi:hypothetical protein
MRDLEDIKRLNDEAVEKASLKRAISALGDADPAARPVARKQSLIAACLLITAFDWKTSEEGPEFWSDLVINLERKAGVPQGTAMLLTIKALTAAAERHDKAA